MSPFVGNSDSGANAVVEKEPQSSKTDNEDLVSELRPSQGTDGHVIEALAEDVSGERALADLEALHQAPSGPAYSVFSHRQRKFIVFMVACAGFFSPLSANIYFPALNALSRDLKVSNGLINLTLTSYMFFQGLAPTIFGDLADMTGRRPTYVLGFIIYIGKGFALSDPMGILLTPRLGANIGLALQNDYAALFLLRGLQSTGSSGTVALGNGVVADIASSGERGKFMGAYPRVFSHLDSD